MKIAVVTDDHKTVSAHFGRAQYYEIFTIENSKVVDRYVACKSNHRHENDDLSHQEGHTHIHNHDHNAMMEPILKCDVLIARGMGSGAYNALKIRSIEPLITDIHSIEEAVSAYLAGTMISHPERLH